MLFQGPQGRNYALQGLSMMPAPEQNIFLLQSIWPASHAPCSIQNSSDTPRVHLPARSKIGKAIWISEAFLPEFLLKRKKGLKKKIPKQNGSIAPLEEIEKDHILKVYDYSGKNKALTARLLGIGLNTLRGKPKDYGVG
jgi:DNA-binding NtrC family response regulator